MSTAFNSKTAAHRVGARFKIALLAASAVALMGSAAHANNGDPGYWDYDGGAILLGPNDLEVGSGSGVVPFGSVGSGGPVSGLSGAMATPGVGLSFQGVSQYDTRALNSGFSFIPPDTMGAVGSSQFMETTNGGYAVYDKVTGVRTKIQSDAAFWLAAGGTVGSSGGVPLNNGDARVLFDSTSGKWIVTSFAGSIDTIQIAISDTSDATGTWKSTSFVGHAGGIADYPTLAIDSKAVYIGTNDFNGASSYDGETLNVINRNDLFSGGAPTTTSLKQFVNPLSAILAGDDRGYAIQGVNQVNGSDSGRILATSNLYADLLTYSVNSPGTAGATLGGVTYMGTTPYGGNGPGRQPSLINPRVIDTLDDRTSSAVFERSGMIYAVHTVTPLGGNHTELVWTVSNAATGALIQEGMIGDSTYDYYQGSIAVNSLGQVVIAYDRSGSVATDGNGDGLADGNISFYAKTFNSISTGEIYNTGTFLLHVSPTGDYHNGSLDGQAAKGRQRWGDYSQVTVDPSDSSSFWAIGEFAREANTPANGHPGGTGGTRWGTWISEISVGTVPEPGTWALMLLGFGFAGAAIRRRRALAA